MELGKQIRKYRKEQYDFYNIELKKNVMEVGICIREN